MPGGRPERRRGRMKQRASGAAVEKRKRVSPAQGFSGTARGPVQVLLPLPERMPPIRAAFFLLSRKVNPRRSESAGQHRRAPPGADTARRSWRSGRKAQAGFARAGLFGHRKRACSSPSAPARKNAAHSANTYKTVLSQKVNWVSV